ncbi:TonB-dependent receptor [uncultured Massilia sp.]|uniref:TonB-dependent receptor n=1 Tax=uncultured Massilia sp. TaxID=169973 RepID=UPI002587D3B1|nr:TonB-dependent receptor [uncultured Massilia sp.]
MQRETQKINLTPLAAAAALMVLSLNANAQQETTDAPTTVVVQGIRASVQESINQRRNADSYVEVITAEDVGKLADKNVADSLQRLSGVSVAAAGGSEGSFGENDRVALRGTPSSLTLTTLNGHSVSSGDWFADNIIAGGRSVSFTLFPSELIGRVTVYKGSQASLIDGGAMGLIDIETRKPLDLLRRQTITGQASIGAMHSEYAKKTDPQLSGMVAWRNDAATVGVLFQGFRQKRHLSRVAQENSIWWDKVEAGSPIANAIPGSVGAIVNYLGGTAWFEQERTRTGGLVDLQIRPNKDLNLDLTVFHSKMDAPNVNHNFMQTMGRFLGNAWAAPSFPASNITGSVSNGVITSVSATVPANCTVCRDMSGSIQEIFSRPVAESQSQFVNLDGKYRINELWTVSGKVGTTKGKGNTESGALSNPIPFGPISYTLNGTDKPITYVTAGSATHAIGGGYCGVPATFGSHVTSKDEETYAQLDLERSLEHPFFRAVKVGARGAKHERSLSVIDNGPLPGLDDPRNLPLYGLTTFPDHLKDVAGIGSNYWTFSQQSVNDWVGKYTAFLVRRSQAEFDIEEPTASAYVQADFGNDHGLSGNFGVRYARTKEDVLKYEMGPSGTFEPRRYENTYKDWLPSVNVRYELAPDMVLRSGLSRTLARPELGAMAGIDLRDQQRTGTTGNPNLAPITSDNFDVGIDWYFAPRSLLAANVFYADIDGYVSYGASSGIYYNQQAQGNTEYQTSSPINSTAKVKGVELNWIQTLPMGFGFNANYTYTDAEETGRKPGSACGAVQYADCTMIGASRNAANVGAYFENDQFSARVNYSWRSGFLNGFSRNTAQYQDDVGTLSATFSYRINDKLSLSLDGKDLNNPTHRSIVKNPGAQDLPGSIYRNGRQWFLTLNGKL